MIRFLVLLVTTIIATDASQSNPLSLQFYENVKDKIAETGLTDAYSYDGLTAEECADIYQSVLTNLTDPFKQSDDDFVYILHVVHDAVQNNFETFTVEKNIEIYGVSVGNKLLLMGGGLDESNVEDMSGQYSESVIKSLNQLQGDDMKDPAKRIASILVGDATFLAQVNLLTRDTIPVIGVVFANEMYAR